VIIAVSSETDAKSKIVVVLRKAGLQVDERKIEIALTLDYPMAAFKDKKNAIQR
jgi:hypothetical protein